MSSQSDKTLREGAPRPPPADAPADAHPDAPGAASGETRQRAVESLAAQVLASLAVRAQGTEGEVDPVLLEGFCARLLGPEPSARSVAAAVLRDHGVSVETILDGYLPAAARRLGDMWCEDVLGFAEVTIGTARLQALLHDLSQSSALCPPADARAPSVMIIVPLEEQHSLGGMAAAAQLRRLGVSAYLSLGQSIDEIIQKISSRRFDMIAISASNSDQIETVRELVKAIRGAARSPVPVVIGGNVVARMPDAKALTGADFATTDPREALRVCGLKLQEPAAGAGGPRARGEQA